MDVSVSGEIFLSLTRQARLLVGYRCGVLEREIFPVRHSRVTSNLAGNLPSPSNLA